MRGLACAAIAFLGLAGCSPPEREPASASPTTSTAAGTPGAAAPARSGRRLSDSERAAMLAALGAEQGTSRKAWFAVAPGDPEAAALKDSLEAVFKQAGWETATQTVTGMVLKPGLSILIAAEEPAAHVTTAQRALEATSFEWKTGTGYGPYYEERKRADPNWPGIALAPGQEFVIVVGPQSPAS
jgi:hypothetical protein